MAGARSSAVAPAASPAQLSARRTIAGFDAAPRTSRATAARPHAPPVTQRESKRAVANSVAGTAQASPANTATAIQVAGVLPLCSSVVANTGTRAVAANVNAATITNGR